MAVVSENEMVGIDPIVFGKVIEKTDSLEARMTRIEDKVDLIVRAVERGKGSWLTLGAVGGVVAAGVETIHYLAGFVKGH